MGGSGREIDSSGRLIRISLNCDCNRAPQTCTPNCQLSPATRDSGRVAVTFDRVLWLSAPLCTALLIGPDRLAAGGWTEADCFENRDHRQEIRQETGDPRGAAHKERNERQPVGRSISLNCLYRVPRREKEREEREGCSAAACSDPGLIWEKLRLCL